jgi:hypothetical protein
MANYIRVRPADFVDGVAQNQVPNGPTMNLVGVARFPPTTECARLRFTCSGTSFMVHIARDFNVGGASTINDCAVFVDGVYAGKITPTLSVVAWYTFNMATGGNHTVELQSGQEAVSGGASLSAGHILAIAGTNLALSPVTASRKLVIFGDSIIAANGGPTPLGVTDILGLLRSSYPGRVSADALGSATYTMYSDNAALVARLARHAAGATTIDLLMQMGTNDYGFSQPSLTAQLTTMFGVLVAMPGLNKMVVLTPITRGTETINGAGFTTGGYRTQIAAAATAQNNPKIVVVDGSALGLNTSTDFFETPAANALHPNDSGAAKMLVGIRGALGF